MPNTANLTRINNPAALANYTEEQIWREPYSNNIYLNEGVAQKGDASWYSAPTPAPAASGTTPPPAGGTTSDPSRTPRFPDFQGDTTVEDYWKKLYANANTPVDEEAIRQKKLQEVQAEIDSIQGAYDTILRQAQIEGQNRVGQTRSVNVRRGLVGSEMGTANALGTESYNTKVNQSIIAEREAKKAAILAAARGRATDEIKSKVDQNKLDAANYIEHLSKLQDDAKSDLATFAKNGGDISTLSDAEYKALLTDSGFKTSAEFEAYFNANKPKAAQVKYEYKELKDGSLIRYGDDGSYKVLSDISLPKTGDWVVKQLADGTVMAYDQNRLDKDGNMVWQNIGNFAKGKGGTGTGTRTTTKLTSTQRSILSGVFDEKDINDLMVAISQTGIDEVMNNVIDPAERKAISDAFKYETYTDKNQLRALGWTEADIKAYENAQTELPNMSLSPDAFQRVNTKASDATRRR